MIDNHLSPRSSSPISSQAHRDQLAMIKISCQKYADVEFENRRSTDTMRFVKPHYKLVLDR